MSGTDSFVRRTLRTVIVLLATLVLVSSCASCLLSTGADWLQQHWHGHHASETVTALLATVR